MKMEEEDLNAEDLESRILALWREADKTGRERLAKLWTGVLANRITLTLDEVRHLTRTDAEALADALPDDALGEWIGKGRAN